MSSSRQAGIGPGDRSHKDVIRNNNTKIERPVQFKKNRHELQNEIVKVSQLLSFVPNSFGDRYISRRYNQFHSQQNVVCPVLMNGFDQCNDDFVHVRNCDGFWRAHAVRECLKTSINMSNETVLFFHDYLTKDILNKSLDRRFDSYKNVEVTGNKQKFDWPCSPRRKAIAATEVSHEISNYCYYSDLSIITWSRAGVMTASFGKDLVIWKPKAKFSISYGLKGITCLAYNFDGKYLAVGVKRKNKLPEVQIWDLSSDSVGVFITSYKYNRRKDEVRSLIWDPKNLFIISGTLSGDVYVHHCSFSLKMLKKLVCAQHCISTVQLSANQKFLSAADERGNVFVWNMKTLEIVFKWSEKDANRALIAWHPWKETYLIVATKLPASIRLIDVSDHEMIAHYIRTDELCRIDAITFSPKSAELVVGVTIFDDSQTSYEILVLASLNRVVDLLSIHDGCVKCLMWNSDGSMLATAGDDNMLNLWNFFGYSELAPVKASPKQKYVNSKFMLGNPSLLR